MIGFDATRILIGRPRVFEVGRPFWSERVRLCRCQATRRQETRP